MYKMILVNNLLIHRIFNGKIYAIEIIIVGIGVIFIIIVIIKIKIFLGLPTSSVAA